MKLLTLIFLSLSLVACDNAIFSSSNSNGNKANAVPDGSGSDEPGEPGVPGEPGGPVFNDNGDLIFLDDSFEREDLFGDINNNMIVGWRGAWDDHGTLGTGFTGNQLGMEIFTDQEMGPAFDGNSATYFYGRPGSSVHRLWLISPSYDLSDYNTVIMNYRYLTVALNDQMDIDANYIEAIRLQVCKGGANACGANSDFIDLNNIGNDAAWVTIAESDINEDDDNFDGTNHLVSDFITDLAVFDLNNPDFVSDKSEVVIRFEVDMRDGFQSMPAFSTATRSHHDGDGDSSDDDSSSYDKCEKYTEKKEKYCELAEEHAEQCSGSQWITQTYKNGKKNRCNNGHAYGHCIQKCIKGNIGRDTKKECLRSCKSCKKADHYVKKCEKFTKKVERYCDDDEPTPTPTPTPTGGTLVDGVILDLVQGIATERDISEIF